MKNTALFLLAAGILSLAGCGSLTSLDLYHDEPIAAQPAADRIIIKSRSGRTIPVTEITDHDQVVRFVEFINALPNKWNVPWENPPVGRIYFSLYRGRAGVGNFFVGPNFFGRDLNNSFSQPATEEQIRAVGEIAGFDLWDAVGGPAFKAAAPKKK